MQGKIIKGIAGFYYVQAENESQYECKAKGIFRKDHKKPLVGDEVTIEVLDEEEKKGSITELLPRRSELFRPAVANIDQAVIVFACREPEPNFNLLDRFLVLMEKRNVQVILCFTKADLATAEFKKEVQMIYEPAGYPVCFTDYHDFEGEGHKKLLHLLSGKVTAFAGPSGVGKSTLVNHFCPEAGMDTGEVSEKIKRGKHTTRHSEIFYLGYQTFLFDTPGFSSLDVLSLEKEELELLFPEFSPYLGKCRFTGCSHISEPSCGIKEAVQNGKISQNRYESYTAFYKELNAVRRYK